ncbi:MAG: hypothetical protein HZA64_15030 [Rhodocyclales bacterium]|nr:hypothetical protein [Rhodocyclales bacterium]
MASAADRRLLGFLAISMILHLLWLAIPLPTRSALPTPRALIAHLVPPAPPEKSVAVARRAERGVAAAPAPDPARTRPAAPAPEPAAPVINLEAAFATARSQAREAPPHTTLDAPPLLTVTAAIARAAQRDTPVETRGTAGEYVTINGKTRCVTPLVVPHFLEGKTMLTQCETRKG